MSSGTSFARYAALCAILSAPLALASVFAPLPAIDYDFDVFLDPTRILAKGGKLSGALRTSLLLYRLLWDTIYGRLWNILEVFVAGVGWLGVGALLRRERPLAGQLSLVLGASCQSMPVVVSGAARICANSSEPRSGSPSSVANMPRTASACSLDSGRPLLATSASSASAHAGSRSLRSVNR